MTRQKKNEIVIVDVWGIVTLEKKKKGRMVYIYMDNEEILRAVNEKKPIESIQ